MSFLTTYALPLIPFFSCPMPHGPQIHGLAQGHSLFEIAAKATLPQKGVCPCSQSLRHHSRRLLHNGTTWTELWLLHIELNWLG